MFYNYGIWFGAMTSTKRHCVKERLQPGTSNSCCTYCPPELFSGYTFCSVASVPWRGSPIQVSPFIFACNNWMRVQHSWKTPGHNTYMLWPIMLAVPCRKNSFIYPQTNHPQEVMSLRWCNWWMAQLTKRRLNSIPSGPPYPPLCGINQPINK